jgi:predicted HTH transcriptional regulator
MKIENLLARSEGKTLEFKRDLTSPEKFLRTAVSFANTAGGIVLIGVEDKTRNVRGVRKPLDEEERIASLLSDGVAPQLLPSIEVLSWRKKQVIAVEVYLSPNRPHYVKRLGPREGVYVRVGSSNRRADASLLAELKRGAENRSFDERPMTELDSEEIDFRALSESFAERRRLGKKDLETLRLVTRWQRRLVPTAGGVILYGKSRGRLFPDAWLRCGRFQGRDKRRIVDSRDLHGYPAEAIDEVLEFVSRHASRGLAIDGARHKERWEVPLLAVREAVINAVVHADYSQEGAPVRVAFFDDRIEVESPGLLPPGLTIEDIRQGVSKLRNRVIGRVFRELGLIEQWGSGIQRMTAACRELGLDEPRLEEVGTHFRVTIPLIATGAKAMDEVETKILDYLKRAGPLPTSRIASFLGLSTRATRTRLNVLVGKGVIVPLGKSARDPRRKYALAE